MRPGTRRRHRVVGGDPDLAARLRARLDRLDGPTEQLPEQDPANAELWRLLRLHMTRDATR